MHDLRTLSLSDMYEAMRATSGDEREAATQEVKRRTKLLAAENKRKRQALKAIKQEMKAAGIK